MDDRADYDPVADAYHRRLPDTSFEAPLDIAMLNAFGAAASQLEGGVVDAGCGTGRLARWLTARGMPVHGVDPSAAMLAIARREQPDARWSPGSLTALPVPDASVAGVLAWYSIIHLPPEQLVDVAVEVVRVIRPGGVALFGFHVGSGSRSVEAAYGTDVTLTAYLHSPAFVAAVLEGQGLRIEARLERAPRPSEHLPQAVLLARKPAAS